MNTRALARHYGQLTPWERVPLIMAAVGRGDEVEHERLVASAPKSAYRIHDHFGLSQAIREVSDWHFMEMLDLAAQYFRAMGMANAQEDPDAGVFHRMLDAALLFGFIFQTKLSGWRLFCKDLNLEPDLAWSCLPGLDTIKQAEGNTEIAAFTPEGAKAYLEQLGEKEPQIPTPRFVATQLRKFLEKRAEWWG